MGLDFSKVDTTPKDIIDVDNTAVKEVEMSEIDSNMEKLEQYDVATDAQKTREVYVNTEEVDKLVSKIELNNLESIAYFGSDVTNEIAKASDSVLNSMSISQINDTGKMMKALSKIKDEPGFFGRLFGNAKKQLEKILDKYHTMGDEIDKIYVQLRGYESEITQSNRKLNDMFDANVEFYHELIKYILAGEQACKELQDYIAKRQADLEATGDNSIQFELTTLNQALMMLEQRVQDLRTAESIAMQSIPMIKTMEFSNYNLVRKINSAFIVTLPVFKQALSQAILLKRQKIQAQAMAELDEKTNEMLIKNATNTVETSKMTAQLASGSSIKIETLEKTWETITNGIEETNRIQEEARRTREEDKVRLEQIKKEFNEKYSMPEPKK